MIHLHQLDGCAPVPLAHYLKALGILRLVAEQADAGARGWWEGDHFRFASQLDEEELEYFFLYQYQPTPIVSPWNKGSGFFMPKDPGLTPLESSSAQRLQPFRCGIEASRALLEDLEKADQAVRSIKAETKDKDVSNSQRSAVKNSTDYKKRLAEAERTFKRLKADLIPDLCRHWRGPHRQWMDAAIVLGEDRKPRFPALLGTGGNDGRLDFTNNFMQRLGEVFDLNSAEGTPRASAPAWLAGALWGHPEPGNLAGKAVGQYLPGTAGGANNSNGPDSKSLLNPMDFLLMMEGSILFTAHATRRFGSLESTRAATAFSINAQGASYASAAQSDEGARGEQWMPLWSHPSSLRELSRLLAEGRAQIGAKPAHEPLDLARAIARLGTARGIHSFQRYGYIERNGQSNLAVPLGRFDVNDHRSEHIRCLDDLDGWLSHLRREARASNAPNRLKIGEQYLSSTLFAATQNPDQPIRWQEVIIALGKIEACMASGSGYKAQPVPRLNPQWVLAAADPVHPEWRMALAFALQARGFDEGNGAPMDPIRRHWLPLDPKRPWRFATHGGAEQSGLSRRPDLVMLGRRGIDDAIALVERRLIEAAQRGERRLPLCPASHAATHAADLAHLLSGGVDLDRTLALARTLMALDHRAWARQPRSLHSPERWEWPDEAWLVIRLSLLPWPLSTPKTGEIRIGTDPAIVRRLTAGDASSAVDLALRRLRAAGIRTTVRTGTVSPATARLWAAALAFPIDRYTAARFLRRLAPQTEL